jgi:hypothetical protein
MGKVLDESLRTTDIATEGMRTVSPREMGGAALAAFDACLAPTHTTAVTLGSGSPAR